jgi:hypothetical protein
MLTFHLTKYNMDKKNCKSRIEFWKEPKVIETFFVGDNTEKLLKFMKTLNKKENPAKIMNKSEKKDAKGISEWEVINSAKELIFDIEDGNPMFYVILYTFNSDYQNICIEHVLDEIGYDKNKTSESDEEIIKTLAIASANGIPVYPNTPEVAPLLIQYHKKLLNNGFLIESKEGYKKRFIFSRSKNENIESLDYLSKLDTWDPTLGIAEIAIIRDAFITEINKKEQFNRILNTISVAISELENILSNTQRKENEIQKCLTKYPILFGTEYVNLIPKHRLGSEYVMDYALEKSNGLIDIVEIESSSLKLFTKDGNPTSYLIHAEQQILDWFEWIEKNNPYARSNLPGLVSPFGFIIIGREDQLSKEEKLKLIRRNLIFKGKLQILTYDDLIKKAKGLYKLLNGE